MGSFFVVLLLLYTEYLGSYGVTLSGQKKCDLTSLCDLAIEVGLPVDPDGLVEDREEVLLGKLTTHDGLLLTLRVFGVGV